ncbi:hypothetical protein C1645_837977 [Glomus cerebriforme]|uniref:Uncharacterized protein n=1 Tax=Glomus cerebriforme TaxID=658196 RepID=A0A397SDM3_9GLOM|nr:hypothetical protein C1645_837977 [Glomus cerebriforme]
MGRKNDSPSSWSKLQGKMFFEFFGPEWEGKMVLCAFSSILESEMYVKLGMTFLWFRHLELGNEVSSRNFYLMHLLKKSLVEMVCPELGKPKNSALEIQD